MVEWIFKSSLSLMIWAPVLGAVMCVVASRLGSQMVRRVGILVSLIPLVLSVMLIRPLLDAGWSGAGGEFLVNIEWITFGNFTVRYALYVDGLALPLIILTALLTTICLIYSTTVDKRVAEYYAFFLLMEGMMIGTFLAADLFLFYVFWEITLVPMYFLIGIWGGERREYASIKFFLYTLVGSVAMLLAFIWIYFQLPAGQKTFIFVREMYPDVPGVTLPDLVPAAVRGVALAPLAWWGIFLGFCIKVPAFPFHTWLPDAHVEAPTAGSVILAGVMLKMGGYAIFRILLPLMPEQSHQFYKVIMVMAVMGVVYGALVAMAQTDFKRLVAYSSVNHMGYFMMGVAAVAAVLTPTAGPDERQAAALAASGALYQQIAHGILTSALFLIVGVIYDRAHTRNLNAFGGLDVQMPAYSGFFRLFVMGSLGLPSMAGFIAELLVFTGALSIPSLRPYTIVAGLGIVITAAFMLWTIQRVLLGELKPRWKGLPDMDTREWISLAPLAVLALLFGIIPMLLIQTMSRYVGVLVNAGQSAVQMSGLY